MTEQNNIENNDVVKQAIDENPHLGKYIREVATGGILTRFIDRIERLEEEKKELLADIREVYSEAKGQGFDTKVMRQIIKLRKMDPADRQEQSFLLDEYKKLVGISE